MIQKRAEAQIEYESVQFKSNHMKPLDLFPLLLI